MFAVPGWSVPSSALKTQTIDSAKPPKESSKPGTENGDDSKKRKRGSGKSFERGKGKSKASDVNTSNVADLYETVIEGRPKIKQRSEKRQKVSTDGEEGGEKELVKVKGEKQEKKKKVKGNTMKDKKREKKLREHAEEANPFEFPTTTQEKKAKPAQSVQLPLPTKAAPKLTPLQASMRQKLVSARFRHLNQTLYTTPSAHSLDLFSSNPEMFTEYHEGFRRQVEVWPENPVDIYISTIKTRGAIRPGKKGPLPPGAIVPLPRTDGTCTIADLGCGDAALSSNLQKESKKMNLKIYSFDLYSPHPLVTRADVSSLPLPDNSTDVAIFCLALMGTNWIDFVEEAFRILRWKGELWIAEIKSRFGRVGKGGVVSHSVGHRQKNQKVLSKKDKAAAEAEQGKIDERALMVEVDENDDGKVETDVSAFVEVLRKRGFNLKGSENGEKPIDLTNKMFVRMHFVKSSTPIKGKGVPVPKGMEEMTGEATWKAKKGKKFLDEGKEEDIPASSEAGVLKPCVYKLR